jgi:hypothetical protein
MPDRRPAIDRMTGGLAAEVARGVASGDYEGVLAAEGTVCSREHLRDLALARASVCHLAAPEAGRGGRDDDRLRGS